MIQKWPRYAELLCAVWLIASSWVLVEPSPYRVVSIAAGVAVMALDVLSIRMVFRYAHLAILAVACAVLGFAYFLAPPETAGTQNLIATSLLLLMLAILPTEALKPPPSWRQLTREPD